MTVAHWESFEKGWLADIVEHLKMLNTTKLEADCVDIPELSNLYKTKDRVFTYNETISRVCVPGGLHFIPDDREELSICDLTSA